MLQIKNTLGGGKPEGLYVWKKSSVACIDSITTQTGKNYTLGNATSDTTVYYSASYTLDETTGTYTLVNPKSATLQYGRNSIYSVEMVKSNYYIWGSTSSNEIYTTNASSTYNVYLKNSDGKVFLESDSANYKYDIHSAKIEYTFIDYVVSDKENAYPDGGEKGGYWYERSEVGAKVAYGTVTAASATSLTITHGLGVKPDKVIIYPSSRANLQMGLRIADESNIWGSVANDYTNNYNNHIQHTSKFYGDILTDDGPSDIWKTPEITEETINISGNFYIGNQSAKLTSGVTYTWLAIKE